MCSLSLTRRPANCAQSEVSPRLSRRGENRVPLPGRRGTQHKVSAKGAQMNESDDYRARGRARMKRLDELAAMAQPAQAAPALPPTKGRAPNAAPPSTKTLEEALAEAEAQIAERVRHARDNAAQIAQREEDQARLKARFDALPQAERRRVLDQAGLRHVSAAPAPINPLRGGRGAAWKPPSNPIDWSHWRLMPVLPLWHAVTLSLNQNPEGFHPDWADDETRKRMDLCMAHVSTGSLKLRDGADLSLPVDVETFHMWAVSLGLSLPVEFSGASSSRPTGERSEIPGDAMRLEQPSRHKQAKAGQVHSTKDKRRGLLDPVIDEAQSQCADQWDVSAVWLRLLELAKQQRTPLVGATDEGLQYTNGEGIAYLTREALGQRITRRRTASNR